MKSCISRLRSVSLRFVRARLFFLQLQQARYGAWVLGVCLATSTTAFSTPNDPFASTEPSVELLGTESPELRALREQTEQPIQRQQEQRQEAYTQREQELLALQAPAWMQELAHSDMPAVEEFRFYPAVVEYLRFYKETPRGHNILTEWLTKQGRYQSLVEETFAKQKVPPFLLAVAAVESTFNPKEGSSNPKGAVGLWQLLPINAQTYNLRLDFWVDERQDPVRSTEATARYFHDLKEQFGSWELALAAFHAGQGAILTSIRANNSNDFSILSSTENGLPYETTRYVPHVLAVALALNHAALLGQSFAEPEASLTYDEVPLSFSVKLGAVAQSLGISEEALSRFNPHLLRGRTPPLAEGERFVLRVPKGLTTRALEQVQALQEPSQTYVVRFGEHPEHIAKRLGLSLRVLQAWNGFTKGAVPPPGTLLLVPASARIQHVGPEPLVPVAVPNKEAVVPGRKRVFYQTLPGDTLEQIAQAFQTTPRTLATWNLLDPRATIPSDMVLDIWVGPSFDTRTVRLVHPSRVLLVSAGSEEFLNTREILRGRKRALYTCQPGDTWDTVAEQLGTKPSNLQRINRLGRKHPLQPGQLLVFYQPLPPEEREQALRSLLPGGFPKGARELNNSEDNSIDAYAWIPAEMDSSRNAIALSSTAPIPPPRDTSAHPALTMDVSVEYPH